MTPNARAADAGESRTPVSLFDILRRHAGAVVACFVVAGAGCLAYRALLHPASVATASVVVENPRLDASGLGASDPLRYFASQLALARLPVVARNAISGLPDAAALSAADVTVTSDQVSDTIVITATLPQGQDDRSVALANAALTSYVAISTNARKVQAEQSLLQVTAALATLRLETSPGALALRTQLTDRQVALRSEAVGPVSLLIASPAQLEPSGRPGVTRVGLVFLLGGTWAGAALAIGRDGAGRRLTHAEDAARLTGLPVLATLTVSRSRPSAAEAVWQSVHPRDGHLLVLPLGGALQVSRRDSAARQAQRVPAILGRFATSVGVVDPAMRTADLDNLTRVGARVVIIAGPRSRRNALQEAMADLARVGVSPAGLIWSHPEPLARIRSAVPGPRTPTLRRPGGRNLLAGTPASRP